MFPCAVAAAASTDPTTKLVTAFFYNPGTMGSSALRTFGARDGDFMMLNHGNGLSSGGVFDSTYYIRCRRLNAADVAGTFTGSDQSLVVILRGSIGSIAQVTGASPFYTEPLGVANAAGFTKSPLHAGFIIWGSIGDPNDSSFRPVFSSPSGISLQIDHWNGIDVRDFVYTRFAPPKPPYANGTPFSSSWSVDNDYNHYGGWTVFELLRPTGGGSAPPLLPMGVLSSGAWDDDGVWSDDDVWKDS